MSFFSEKIVKTETGNIWARRSFHLILVVFTCLTKEAKADEARHDWECKNNGDVIMGMEGTSESMMSRVASLERCYFIFTQEGSGEQCCYNLAGFGDDCETSEEYKRRNNLKCAKENVEITLDSLWSGTCNITIKSVSEDSAGRYKSYEADHTALVEEFCLIVSGPKEEGSSVVAILLISLAVTLSVIVAVGLVLWRNINNRSEDGYFTLFDNYEVRYKDGWKFQKIQRTENETV